MVSVGIIDEEGYTLYLGRDARKICDKYVLDQRLYLDENSKKIVLHDYVPKTIELHLPDYEARSQFVLSDEEWYTSDDFARREMLDQMACGTTWEEHVTVYDDFFERHPEFSGLIKDRDAYEKWRAEEVPY